MLFFIILQYAQSALNCPGFSCKLKSDYFTENTCSYYDTSHYTPIYYLNSCSDINKPYCSFELLQNSTCKASPSLSSPLKYPGEKCLQSSDCSSLKCTDQKCTGIPQGSLCINSYDCSPGLFCDNFNCKTVLPVNSTKCISEFDCDYSSGCLLDGTYGTCTEYFSVLPGERVTGCKNGESFLCQSGRCIDSLCIDVIKSNSLPTLCINDGECTPDGQFGDCQCGINPNGNSFCKLKGGDEPYASYLEIMKKWNLSGRKQFCNTKRRHTYACAADLWDRGQAVKMQEYLFYIQNYWMVIEFDECAREIFIPEYPKSIKEEICASKNLVILALFYLFL